MSQLLDELLERVHTLPPEVQQNWRRDTMEATKHMAWVPNPGPQTQAYFSEADELLYGGEPGGGKSDLSLGLAFTAHKRSLLLRRQYTDLSFLIERAIQINGSRDGYSGQPPPKLRTGDGRLLDFGAAAKVGDEQHWMGNPHDLIVFDEATQFARLQVRFLMGWLRSDDPAQRCRVILATNPALRPEGLWVNEAFAPWLDARFPKPAKPGELRWYVSDADDKDRWVEGPGEYPIQSEGATRMVQAKSRTYIPASVKDNPAYVASGYQKQLDALPESVRSILLGGFRTTFKDVDNQIIPTAWVLEAQKRWRPKPPEGVPMCSMGVDCSGGGNDPMVIAWRYDGWYAPLVEIPAKEIPMDRSGAYCGGMVLSYRRDKALVVIDLGGGYGGPTYEHLIANDIDVRGYKGAEATIRRSADKVLKFTNKRSAAYWLFREALDPGQPGGSPIALPDDPVLVADLTAPTFESTPNGIKLEPKDDVMERLGRSPDHGDAVVMAWFEGPKEVTHAMEWMDQRAQKSMRGQRPQVVVGRQHARRH